MKKAPNQAGHLAHRQFSEALRTQISLAVTHVTGLPYILGPRACISIIGVPVTSVISHRKCFVRELHFGDFPFRAMPQKILAAEVRTRVNFRASRYCEKRFSEQAISPLRVHHPLELE